MPRVVRAYEHTDFSDLLNEMNAPPTKEEKAQDIPVRKQDVNEFQRKRASLLSNPKMRYAYSASEQVLHDRNCKLVKEIEDKHFRMRPDLDPGMEICPKCYRSAIIRSAIGDDGKHINAYVNLFNRMNASNNSLRRLIIEHGAKLYGIEIDRVYLKVHDDRWMLWYKDGRILLYHNNYEIIGDYERLFKSGFHPQNIAGEATFPNMARTMCFYSWKNHAKSFRFADHLRKCEELRQVFAGIPNFTRQKKPALFSLYYEFIDLNCYGIRLCRSNGLAYSIHSIYHHPNTKYTTVTCKLRLWHRKRFTELMEKLKEYCIEQQAAEYGDYCSKLGEGKVCSN